MWFQTFTLYLLLSLSYSDSSHTVLTVGRCDVIKEKASFDCSRRNLTTVPQQIWQNVTKLDLSENLLNLEPSEALWTLRDAERLTKLNLSGNYLPLVVKQHFYHLRYLEVLDISGCRVAAVEADVLQNLPRLKKFFIHNNNLKPDISKGFRRWSAHVETDGIRHTGSEQEEPSHDALNLVTHNPFHRRLLAQSTTVNTSNSTAVIPEKQPSDSWKYLVAVLVLAIGISVLIVIAAKCKLLHHYLASYRHSRLNEADRVSQGDPANFQVGFSGHHASGGDPHLETGDVIEDDDGFIEDNYIQASERERVAREVEQWPEDDDEDMEEFSIG